MKLEKFGEGTYKKYIKHGKYTYGTYYKKHLQQIKNNYRGTPMLTNKVRINC